MIDLINLDLLEADHARFNANKTLGYTTKSEFDSHSVGSLLAHRDAQRPDSYYNRVIGITGRPTAALREAIAWTEEAGNGVRLDVTVGGNDDLSAEWLTGNGFSHESTIVWLHRRESAPRPIESQVRELTVEDRPAIRSLIATETSIADDRWALRRHHYCSRAFRWFGIFAQDRLVSAASAWRHPQGTVLGSAFTHPSFRARGFHSQLLQARIEAIPGQLFVDCSPDTSSHRNCLRAGFIEYETRQVWVRPPKDPQGVRL